MKSKIFLLSILSIFIFSCKSDDESSGIQFEGKRLSHIEWSSGDGIDFTYNSDHTVKTIDISDDIILNFNYVNNRIETLIFQWGQGGASDIYRFTYDGNGKINSFSKADEVYEVTYVAAENKYTYQADEDRTISIGLEGEDVFYLSNQEGMNIQNYTFNYGEGKGPLSASNPISLHILLSLPDPLVAYITTCFSKKAIESYVNEDEIFEFENTFDEQGFIIQRDFMNSNDLPASDIFNYTEE